MSLLENASRVITQNLKPGQKYAITKDEYSMVWLTRRNALPDSTFLNLCTLKDSKAKDKCATLKAFENYNDIDDPNISEMSVSAM